ncbi:MAG: metallopeptidase family protein [Patescibacteria group bacterium]
MARDAIADVPPHIQKAFDNVAFVIEDRPRPAKAREVGLRRGEILLGLYEGIPKARRGPGYFGVLPDKITIFRQPLEEESAGDERRLQALVRDVIIHEIGHHLGFDDKELRAIEGERRKRKRVGFK